METHETAILVAELGLFMPTLSQFLEGYQHGGRVGDIREMTQASKAEDLFYRPSASTAQLCDHGKVS